MKIGDMYIQKFVERFINHLDVLDGNASYAIVTELFSADNTITIKIHHFKVGFDECLHRLQSKKYILKILFIWSRYYKQLLVETLRISFQRMSSERLLWIRHYWLCHPETKNKNKVDFVLDTIFVNANVPYRNRPNLKFHPRGFALCVEIRTI